MNLEQFERHDGVRIRKFKSIYYLLTSEKNYQLNELGAVVLKYIGKNMEVVDLCNKISENYTEKNLKKINDDVRSFIDFLLSEGIIYKK